MHMRIIKILIIVLIVAGTGLARGADEKRKVVTANIDDDGIQRVEVTGGGYFFDPDHIIVKVNVPVELTFKKTPGITPHNIIISVPDAGIDINEDMGKDSRTIRFIPLKTGKYAMYCDKRFLFFKSHRERGMEGILEVVENE